MDTPKRAGDTPIGVEVEKGKSYAWCACGLSSKQPFCDGSHKGTAFTPEVTIASTSGKQFFCTCKQTAKSPFCDGSHSRS